jgi:23S rRNA (pseudouridine1915-N3)-methyltransferase
MRVAIHAVGRMKASPERDLVARYLDRFDKAGKALGLDYSGLSETVESRAGDAATRMCEESDRLRQAASSLSLVLLDERGHDLSSTGFADLLASRRDRGVRGIIFAIGGPDGHDPALRAEADDVVAFGSATWPHQLLRVMLAEQLYRAATILSGHPYHRA